MKTTLSVLFFVLIICLVYLLINVSTIHTEKIVPIGVNYEKKVDEQVKLAHKWGLENTAAKWFLKVDDDCYFNDRNILNGIMKYDPNDYIVIGSIAKGFSVHRSGKWEERDYIKKKYPPFPIGSSGHLSSRALVSGIVSRMDELYEYQGEDISMGIWINDFFPQTKIINKRDRMGGKSSCNHKSWVCGHDLTASDFKKMVLYNNMTIRGS